MPLPAEERDEGSSGFTLIELLVSLLLFALISLAGVSLVQTVVDVQMRTEARGSRLAQIQRSLYLIGADFEQLRAGPVVEEGSVAFVRSSARGDYPVAYTFADGVLRRASGEDSAIVLDGIQTLSVRILVDGAWVEIPRDPTDDVRPRAVEIAMVLLPRENEPSGLVRRVIELPAALP